MSQNNNINDPLEQFFKSKVEDYDINYNEEDWKDLEGRLDKLDQKQAAIPMPYIAAAAVILLFSLLGYFTYENYKSINQVNQQLSNQTIQPTPLNVPPSSQDSNNASRPVTNAPSKSNLDQSQNGASESLSDVQRPPSSKTEEDPAQELASADAIQAVSASELPEVFNSPTIPAGEQNVSNSAMAVSEQTIAGNVIADQNNITEEISALKPSPREPLQSYNAIEHSSSRWVFALSMAPDFSTVGSLADFQSPGFKIGIQTEFNINRSFGVSAGIIHSTVNYSAGRGEYNPPGEYGAYGITPSRTLADCIIIDIPLKLKYNFKHFEQSRIFATAGFSTYIMLNEEYQFSYENNDYGLPESWSGRTGTRHWMSNAGFSIGYEQDVHQNVSLRVEPFINIPLQDVGWGNVQLFSMGSFFSINYKL